MKKLFAVLTALLPAVYMISMAWCAVLGAEDGNLFAVLGILLLIGFLFPIWFAVLTSKADKKFLAVCNLWFYGGNLFLFAVEIALFIHRLVENQNAAQNGAMEGGLVLVLLFILYLTHWINYLVVRIVGAISTSRILEGVGVAGHGASYSIWQLFPVADVISAVLVLRKVNAFQACQQPPIEMK